MKKILSVFTVLMIALLVLAPSLSVKAAEEQAFAGIWTDTNFDKMVLTIVPSEAAWFDERMGEEADARKYVVRMNWPSSDSEESVYNIVAVLDETGKTLAYEGGMFAEYSYDENGDVVEEDTGLLEDNGTGSFNLSEDGSLRWQDSCLKDAAEMVLRKEIAVAPSAEEIRASFCQAVAGLEQETAGASLKLVEAVRDTFVFCAAHPFWCMDKETLSANLAAAQDQLSAGEKASFDQNRSVLTAEVARLLQEKEETGSDYSDAGIEKQIEELRNSPEIRLSAEAFIAAVEALNSK